MMIVGGRLRSKRGVAIVGGRVELVDRPRRAAIASAFSDVHGNFCMRVSDATAAREKTGLTIRAVGEGNRVLVQGVRLPGAEQSAIAMDLTISPGPMRDFRPAAPLLPRLTGSVLDADVLPMIDAAVGLVALKDGPGYSRFARVVRNCLPALARFESVLDDAWMVLDGNEAAAQRLRRTLAFLATQAAIASPGPPVPRDPRVRFDSLPPGPRDGDFPILDPRGYGRRCALPVERLVPVLAATLRMGMDAEDLSSMLAGFDAGLHGVVRFESLTGLARDALSSGQAGFLGDELSRLAVEMSIDGDRPFEGGLEWPYPPPEPFPPQPLELCYDLRTKCFQGLVDSWRLQFAFDWASLTLPYRITSVRSETECPGRTVTIEGSNFGTIPGQVIFPDRQGDGTISVEPVPGTWTSARIEAVVPVEAGSGLIRLAILEGSLASCGGTIPLYRQGNGIAFHGGGPYVSSVTIDGKAAGSIVAPGTNYTVAWKASPDARDPDAVLVQVYEDPGTQVFSDTMPANGMVTLTASGRTSPGKIRATVFAFGNSCPPPAGDPHNRSAEADIDVATKSIGIEGVEVTQGIQLFSLLSPSGVRLETIANKDTIVRVYVAVHAGSNFYSALADVTGYLKVDGTLLLPINGISPGSPASGNPFITARAAVDIDRKHTNHTLNFRIPAALATGTKTLEIFVWGSDWRRFSAYKSMSWEWETRAPMPLRFVRVQDDRPAADGGTGTLPTEAQARYTLDRAFDLLPGPATNVGPAWHDIHVFTQGDRVTLVDELVAVRQQPDPATGVPDISGWIGLLHPWIGGRAANTVATCPTYENRDRQGAFRICVAHEITHWRAGACHTEGQPGSCAAHSGSIQIDEVAFDPYWNETVVPALSYFKGVINQNQRHWIPPRIWNFLRARL